MDLIVNPGLRQVGLVVPSHRIAEHDKHEVGVVLVDPSEVSFAPSAIQR